MKRHLLFFFLVALAGALAHYLLTQVLVIWLLSTRALPAALDALTLWILDMPVQFILSSSVGDKLPPRMTDLLVALNSLIWGLAISALWMWMRKRWKLKA